MDMSAALLEVIKSSLPENTAGVMKEYLTQAQKDKDTLADYKRRYNDIHAINDTHLKKITDLESKLKELQTKHNELLTREEAVKEKEKLQRVFELEVSLKAERSAHDQVIRLTEAAFRNPRFIHRSDENYPLVMKDQYSGADRVEWHTKTTSKETTQE